jgi:hypothetical protein
MTALLHEVLRSFVHAVVKLIFFHIINRIKHFKQPIEYSESTFRCCSRDRDWEEGGKNLYVVKLFSKMLLTTGYFVVHIIMASQEKTQNFNFKIKSDIGHQTDQCLS